MRQLGANFANLNLKARSETTSEITSEVTSEVTSEAKTEAKTEAAAGNPTHRVHRVHRVHRWYSETRPRRCVFYDLETSIVSRGKHVPLGMPFRVLSTVPETSSVTFGLKHGMRRNLIVEIGAVDVDATGHRTTFHRFLDPRIEHLTLSETFHVTGQSVEATLRFWQKLFGEKKMLAPFPKDALASERMAAFDALFDQPQFMSPHRALSHFIAYVYGTDGADANPLLIAHNGASFDAPILRAYLHRCKLPPLDREWMVDSIPVIKRAVPRLKSYTLGALHRKLVGVPFQAHHASSDALALMRVCQTTALIEGVSLHRLWSKTNPPLTSVKGIGPKTSKALRERGIEDLQTLEKLVRENSECPLKCLQHVWKSLKRKYGRRGTAMRKERNFRNKTSSRTEPRSKSV